MTPSSLKPRHATQPQLLTCKGLTWTASQHWTTKWWQRKGKMPSFAKKFSASLQAFPPEDCWVFMYPLQLLASGLSLAPILGKPATAQLQATTDMGSIPAPLTSSLSDTPAPQPGIKWQCYSSNQGMPNPRQDEEEAPDDTPKEPPHKKQKTMSKAFKDVWQEDFSKDSKVERVAWQTYYRAHKAIFKKEGLYDLTSVFWQMARVMNSTAKYIRCRRSNPAKEGS